MSFTINADELVRDRRALGLGEDDAPPPDGYARSTN